VSDVPARQLATVDEGKGMVDTAALKAYTKKETRPVLSAVIGHEEKRWKIRIAMCAREIDIFA